MLFSVLPTSRLFLDFSFSSNISIRTISITIYDYQRLLSELEIPFCFVETMSNNGYRVWRVVFSTIEIYSSPLYYYNGFMAVLLIVCRTFRA